MSNTRIAYGKRRLHAGVPHAHASLTTAGGETVALQNIRTPHPVPGELGLVLEPQVLVVAKDGKMIHERLHVCKVGSCREKGAMDTNEGTVELSDKWGGWLGTDKSHYCCCCWVGKELLSVCFWE